MGRSHDRREGSGPFNVGMVVPGSRYELANGHAYYIAPVGGDGARGTLLGAQVLDTDPAVTEAGIDPGYSVSEGDLLAPDVGVGNVPDKPGWIRGAPALAVEYAGRGRDEARLRDKITTLLEAGTRWVWVVRLVGPRRVEVHEKGVPFRTEGPGSQLVAPGVLHNAVAVEALYDRDVAHEAILRNLLQRRGYQSLEEVAAEGRRMGREEGRAQTREKARAEGRGEGYAEAVLRVLSRRGVALSGEQHTRIHTCREATILDRWLDAAIDATSADALFGP